jgi:hypothetical protein
MNALVHPVTNVDGASNQTKMAKRRKLLTWIGTSESIIEQLEQRTEANTEAGMLMKW